MPPVGESDALKRAKAYAAELQPLTRPQQLAWFGRKLRIRPEVLLRLIGYSSAVAKKHAANGESVETLAEQKPDGTLWVTELFREMVARRQYSLERTVVEFHGPPPETVELAIPVGTRTGLTPNRVQELLLRKIRAGGRSVFRDLSDFVRITNPPLRRATPTKG